MTIETTGSNRPEAHKDADERKRFSRLRSVGIALAGITMTVGGMLYVASERTDSPVDEPTTVTSPVTTEQVDVPHVADEEQRAEIAECHELRPLDTCIAGDFGSSEMLSPSQVDAPYAPDEERRIAIAECHEVRPLDDCIASNF